VAERNCLFRTSIESCKVYGSTGFFSFFFLLIAKIVLPTDKFYLAAEALAIQARAV